MAGRPNRPPGPLPRPAMRLIAMMTQNRRSIQGIHRDSLGSGRCRVGGFDDITTSPSGNSLMNRDDRTDRPGDIPICTATLEAVLQLPA